MEEEEMAIWMEETMAPARRARRRRRRKMPKRRGQAMTRMAGGTISRREASVEMAMHLAWSGGAWPGVPSRRPGISRNWRATSLTISFAAWPTDFMVMAENQ